MTEKRFQLNKDIEWWFVKDNTIKVNEFGYRDDLIGEDKYRGLKQELTEEETVELLNEQQETIKHLEEYCGDVESDVKRFQEENDNCKNDYRELFSNYVALEEENEQLRRYVYHCPQICNIILAYLRKSETEDVKAVSDAMGDDKYFDEEIDTLRSWE